MKYRGHAGKSHFNAKKPQLLRVVSAALLGLLCVARILNAEAITGGEKTLLTGEDASEWEGMVKLNTEVKRSGPGSFELYGTYPTELISTRMIPVDMDKSYTASVWFRSLDEKLPASGYLGMRMYDEDKTPILIKHVHAYPETESSLALDGRKGAAELLVIANPEWLKLSNVRIAFSAEKDYADLPNFDLSPSVKKIIDEGNRYRVLLNSPLEKNYPSGIRIRLHSTYGAPSYNLVQGWMPAEWKHFSRQITGEASRGSPGYQFWRGTKYIRLFVWFGNWQRIPEEGAVLLVDDIKLTESEICTGDVEWDEWKFRKDPECAGISGGWYGKSFNDSGWNTMELPAFWADTWAGKYLGYGWYRTEFKVPYGRKGKTLLMRFLGVDEQAWVFINGRPAGEHTVASENTGVGDLWNAPFDIRVGAEFLKPGEKNQLTVLVHASASNGGIWRPVHASFVKE